MKKLSDIFNKKSKIFVICQPGFEEELICEIEEVWPQLIGIDGRPQVESMPEIKILKGGLAMETDYILAFQFNYFLKLASRVLIRLAEFRCKDLPKLYQRTMSLPWNQILKSPNFELRINAKKSRLNNEKRISETIRAAILKTKLTMGNVVTEPDLPLIFVRNDSDTISISIDTSGELLYKRGWSPWKEKAPLRESAAHFALRKLINHENLDEITLIDPMCGSGTFLLEALSYNVPNFNRRFGFYNLKICPKIFLSPTFPLNYKIKKQVLFSKIQGKDIDSKAISTSEINKENFILKTKFENSVPVLFEVQDLFSDVEMNDEIWIICNPPYGVRLNQGDGEVNKIDFPRLWMTQIMKIYNPQKIAFLYPKEALKDLKPLVAQYGFKKISQFPFKNGGLDVNLWTLEK